MIGICNEKIYEIDVKRKNGDIIQKSLRNQAFLYYIPISRLRTSANDRSNLNFFHFTNIFLIMTSGMTSSSTMEP